MAIKFVKTEKGSFVLTDVRNRASFISKGVLISAVIYADEGTNVVSLRVNPIARDRFGYLEGMCPIPVNEFVDVDEEQYSAETLNSLFEDYFLPASMGGSESTSGGADLKSFSVEITRPANVTTYAAGDVVGDVTGVLKEFVAVAKAAGKGVRIYRVRVQSNDTGVQAGQKFNIHLYNSAPDVTGLADNAAFSITYANATKRVGKIPVVIDPVGLVGSTDYMLVGLNPVGTSVYAILETVSGFTPSANSTKITLVIDCELSNN